MSIKNKLGIQPEIRNVVMNPITLLDQTISATPTESEVQLITDKVDEILTAMKAKGWMES